MHTVGDEQMSNRFAAGLSKIKDASGKAPALAPVHTPEEQPLSAPVASGIAPSRKGKVVISAYFDPAVRQQFAILAVKQNKSQAALMADALNMLFEKFNEPPIARA